MGRRGASLAVVVGGHHLQCVDACCSSAQRCLVRLGGDGGNQRVVVVEVHLRNGSVGVVGGSLYGDVGERCLALCCEAGVCAASLWRGDAHRRRCLVQRVALAEVPHLLTSVHLGLLAYPVPLVGQFQQPYLHTVVARSPDVELSPAEAVVAINGLGRCRTVVVVYPNVECRLHTAEGAGAIARAMDLHDGNRSHVGIGRSTAHGVAADGDEGGNEVGNLVHGVVGEHAAHGESAEIDAVAVNLVLCGHLVDKGLDEVDVAVAAGVPRLVDAIREDDDELGSVAHGLHADIVVFELIVDHPSGILAVAVAEDEQRAVLAQILRCIGNVGAVSAVDGDGRRGLCVAVQTARYEQHSGNE